MQVIICNKLESITLDADNPYFTLEDGFLFNKDKTCLIICPAKNGLTAYSIPASVTTIKASAFRSNNSLESISIPNGVSTIEEETFGYCSNLSIINLPSTLEAIRRDAFAGCSKITKVNVPSLETWMGLDLVSYSDNLLTQDGAGLYIGGSTDPLTELVVPESITAIKMFTFFGYKRLTSVVLHDKVTAIGISSFQNCSGLSSFDFSTSLESIGNRAFNSSGISGDLVLPNSVTYIGVGAFEDTGLVSIVMPNGLTAI